MNAAWHAKIFGISLMIGFFPITSLSSTANADPIGQKQERRLGGRRMTPRPIPPQTPQTTAPLSEVIPWSSNIYLNDGGYLGIALQIVSVPGANVSFLQTRVAEVNSAIQMTFQNESCFEMNFAQLGNSLRDALNALDPSGVESISGISIVQNFCEPYGPVDGEMLPPQYH